MPVVLHGEDALSRFTRGDHITDVECQALRLRFRSVVNACRGFPDYRIVVHDAIQHVNRLDSMLEGRRMFPEKKKR